MPERDKLSWLTPKRRRTTGNLKTNGHMKKVAEEGFGAIMEDGVQDQGLERPPGVSRPASQPHVPQISKGGDGGLFYAYARKVRQRIWTAGSILTRPPRPGRRLRIMLPTHLRLRADCERMVATRASQLPCCFTAKSAALHTEQPRHAIADMDTSRL